VKDDMLQSQICSGHFIIQVCIHLGQRSFVHLALRSLNFATYRVFRLSLPLPQEKSCVTVVSAAMETLLGCIGISCFSFVMLFFRTESLGALTGTHKKERCATLLSASYETIFPLFSTQVLGTSSRRLAGKSQDTKRWIPFLLRERVHYFLLCPCCY
jgi:hypothetical protein